MPQALPVMQVVSTGLGILSGAKSAFGKKPKMNALSMDQATTQAKGQLNPLWERNITTAQNNLSNNLIGRGFFGQAPGAAQQVRLGQDMGLAKSGAIAELAANLYNASRGQAMQQQSINQQGQLAGMGGLFQGGGMFGDMANQYPYFGTGWGSGGSTGGYTPPYTGSTPPYLGGSW
jgi:hypothetical protein